MTLLNSDAHIRVEGLQARCHPMPPTHRDARPETGGEQAEPCRHHPARDQPGEQTATGVAHREIGELRRRRVHHHGRHHRPKFGAGALEHEHIDRHPEREERQPDPEEHPEIRPTAHRIPRDRASSRSGSLSVTV